MADEQTEPSPPPQPSDKPHRVPVDYRYDAVNPTFLKWMAKIGAYAADKYGAWEQYTKARLVGEKSPVNHIQEHLRSFVMNEPYDHFDGDVRWHLVAVAYNAMMEFYYVTKFGHIRHPLTVDATMSGDGSDLGSGKGARLEGAASNGHTPEGAGDRDPEEASGATPAGS